MVLDFNCADDPRISKDLLAKLGVTIPTILVWSSAAQLAAYQQYKALAVPTTYILGCDGKVADSWIGCDRKDRRGLDVLAKLGIR
ncbi:MAG: hypothetical protein AB1486_06235 [Planctomycetota bacterium]